MEKRILLGENRGVEYYPEDDTLLLIRCPQCGQENYALNVARGICTWCGFDGRELLKEEENTERYYKKKYSLLLKGKFSQS